MKYFKILALVGAIMLTCVNNSEAKAASWEKSFILDENSRDIKLMSNEENPWSDYDIRDDLEKEFKVSSNEIEYDYSRIHTGVKSKAAEHGKKTTMVCRTILIQKDILCFRL